jgi:flavin reductase (DIM6/NTAB) family NADH-FMN oxidoreductase RutF
MEKQIQKPYRLLYPMKVVLVTSGHDGKDNVMTACWCFPLSADPPLFGVSVSKKRFSYNLIEESKEFVINVPGPDLIDAVRICGENSGADKDKFALAKLTKTKSVRVSAPSISECHTSIECKVVDSIETGDHVLFVGEAVNFRVSKKEMKSIVQTKEGKMKIV